MALRPVYVRTAEAPFVVEHAIEFEFHPGSSRAQKQRSIANLHAAFAARHPDEQILEVSSKSSLDIGVRLSAFNLTIRLDGSTCSVESAFQGAKCFTRGGPFVDLLEASSLEAKRDPRLRNSGPLTGFSYRGQNFPLYPRTYFYDWLYAGAVYESPDLLEAAQGYSAFTDIEFNPARSINGQARALALVTGLRHAGLLDEALDSPAAFRRIAYPEADSGPEPRGA